jgi:hypothetical protein
MNPVMVKDHNLACCLASGQTEGKQSLLNQQRTGLQFRHYPIIQPEG